MVERKIIPMIYDEVFKSVLQDKESEGYLVDIINNVTGIKKDYMKGNIVFKNVELPKNSVREKGKATDLIVEIKENIINLEMNKNYYEGLYDKNDSYLEKIKEGSITRGQIYPRRKKIIQINFDNFKIFDERIIIKFEMIDKERGLVRSKYVYNSDVEIYHVNLQKIKEKYYNKEKLSRFEKELLMMTLDDERELKDVSKGDKEMEYVAKKISKVSKEEEMQGIYDIEERQEFIQNRIREYAMIDGYKEGYDEGTKKGIEEGIKKGSLNKQKQIAKNLLEKGIDINIISSSTGLSKEEIEKLKKDQNRNWPFFDWIFYKLKNISCYLFGLCCIIIL